MSTTTITAQAVFAVTDYTMTRVRLSEPIEDWHTAQERWNTYDWARLGGRVTVINGEPVRFFVVRAMDDPEWKDAQVIEHRFGKPARPEVRFIDFDAHHFMTKSGPLSAVREYAAAQGIRGTEGGYLRREDGSVVVQGWWNYIRMNIRNLRKDRKAVAAALAYHFGVKPPQPRKARKPVTRTVDGIKFIAQGDKQWMTEDGHFVIEWTDDFEYECDDVHPMRISRERRIALSSVINQYGTTAAARMKFLPGGKENPVYGAPQEEIDAVIDGRKGYQCPGGEYHFYGLWVSGAVKGEPEVIARDESFAAALSHVAKHIATGETWE